MSMISWSQNQIQPQIRRAIHTLSLYVWNLLEVNETQRTCHHQLPLGTVQPSRAVYPISVRVGYLLRHCLTADFPEYPRSLQQA